MKIIKNIFELNKAIKNYNSIGFVPTMGGIHNGHISLIKTSQRKKLKTIVSIFVNPTQFNRKSDFINYPRNIKKDIQILTRLKIDYLFIPDVKEIYMRKMKKFNLKKSEKVLCAKYRVGHFEGVLNVMNRLLNIIKAKKIFMGEKDFQQLFLINKYLRNKHKFEIINCPIIRDKNKIALSTRNELLNKYDYIKASLIAKYLLKLKKKINVTDDNLHLIMKKNIEILEHTFKIKIDYLEFRNEKDLKLALSKKKYRLFIGYYINKVRLIDNF